MSRLLSEYIKELEDNLKEAKRLKEESKTQKRRIRVVDVAPLIQKLADTNRKQNDRVVELTQQGSDAEDEEEDVPMAEPTPPPPAASTVHHDYVPDGSADEGAEDDGDDDDQPIAKRAKKRQRTEAPVPIDNGGVNTFKEKFKNKKKDAVHKRAVVDGKITKNPSAVLKHPNTYFKNTGSDKDIETAPDNVLLNKTRKVDFYDNVTAKAAVDSNAAVSALTKNNFNIVKTILDIVSGINAETGFEGVVQALKDLAKELKSKNAYIPMAENIFKALSEKLDVLAAISYSAELDGKIRSCFADNHAPSDVVKALQSLKSTFKDNKTLNLAIAIAKGI
jgi:hypothetical protein